MNEERKKKLIAEFERKNGPENPHGYQSDEWNDMLAGWLQAHSDSDMARDAERWRFLRLQHEIDDEAATTNRYGTSYPRRTLTVFQDDGADGLEPVPCDRGELDAVIDSAIKDSQP